MAPQARDAIAAQSNGSAEITLGRSSPSAPRTVTVWPGCQKRRSTIDKPTLCFRCGDHAAEVICPIRGPSALPAITGQGSPQGDQAPPSNNTLRISR